MLGRRADSHAHHELSPALNRGLKGPNALSLEAQCCRRATLGHLLRSTVVKQITLDGTL